MSCLRASPVTRPIEPRPRDRSTRRKRRDAITPTTPGSNENGRRPIVIEPAPADRPAHARMAFEIALFTLTCQCGH
jgi:hypothetical protein